MAPLQRRAFYGLIFGLAWAIVMVIVFLLKGGATAFDTDQTFRLIMDSIWIGGLIVFLVLFDPIVRKTSLVDERDRLIYDRSSRIQWLAVILTLAAWVIVLAEGFRGRGVPTIYLFLMFITVLCVSSIAGSIGILIGYWRMNRNGQDK